MQSETVKHVRGRGNVKNSVESVENAAEKKERRNIKVMDLILVIVGVSLLVFTIVMIQLFKVYGTVPDTLITCVFATLGGECGIMGWIKTTKDRNRERKKKHKYKKVKKNKSASRAPAGESIEQRPEEIDGREEFGHWEGDTVYSGKGKRKTTRALLTLTERKTRKEIIIAIPNRKAETVVKALDALERKLGARRFRAIFKSITFDNGTEFAAAEELERSCINKHLPRTKVYFCHPYSSWERGTNENTNGMIRRRFPKGTNFAAVTNAQITQAENWINNYPRKILGYKSSEIVFRECLRELGIAA